MIVMHGSRLNALLVSRPADIPLHRLSNHSDLCPSPPTADELMRTLSSH